MSFGYEIKSAFFDRSTVLRAAERATTRALAKAGSFIRTTARTKVLKRRKRPAEAGSPPSVHSSEPRSLKNILFGLRRRGGVPSVVVGPVYFTPRARTAKTPGSTVPAVLETGGTVILATRNNQRRAVRFHERPFMQPAFTQTIPQLPEQFRHTISN